MTFFKRNNVLSFLTGAIFIASLLLFWSCLDISKDDKDENGDSSSIFSSFNSLSKKLAADLSSSLVEAGLSGNQSQTIISAAELNAQESYLSGNTSSRVAITSSKQIITTLVPAFIEGAMPAMNTVQLSEDIKGKIAGVISAVPVNTVKDEIKNFNTGELIVFSESVVDKVISKMDEAGFTSSDLEAGFDETISKLVDSFDSAVDDTAMKNIVGPIGAKGIKALENLEFLTADSLPNAVESLASKITKSLKEAEFSLEDTTDALEKTMEFMTASLDEIILEGFTPQKQAEICGAIIEGGTKGLAEIYTKDQIANGLEAIGRGGGAGIKISKNLSDDLKVTAYGEAVGGQTKGICALTKASFMTEEEAALKMKNAVAGFAEEIDDTFTLADNAGNALEAMGEKILAENTFSDKTFRDSFIENSISGINQKAKLWDKITDLTDEKKATLYSKPVSGVIKACDNSKSTGEKIVTPAEMSDLIKKVTLAAAKPEDGEEKDDAIINEIAAKSSEAVNNLVGLTDQQRVNMLGKVSEGISGAVVQYSDENKKKQILASTQTIMMDKVVDSFKNRTDAADLIADSGAIIYKATKDACGDNLSASEKADMEQNFSDYLDSISEDDVAGWADKLEAAKTDLSNVSSGSYTIKTDYVEAVTCLTGTESGCALKSCAIFNDADVCTKMKCFWGNGVCTEPLELKGCAAKNSLDTCSLSDGCSWSATDKICQDLTTCPEEGIYPKCSCSSDSRYDKLTNSCVVIDQTKTCPEGAEGVFPKCECINHTSSTDDALNASDGNSSTTSSYIYYKYNADKNMCVEFIKE